MDGGRGGCEWERVGIREGLKLKWRKGGGEGGKEVEEKEEEKEEREKEG